MSSVLPIDTHRYQSGDYTLEVTAHPSPLSQWSDRPVVRQLRFNLWVEHPERKRLATGNQHQLVTLSDTVESYVQANLTQQAWPNTHRLSLLNKEIELSTLQLFNLAEVLNAYGQTHITLPAAPKQRRPIRWWTGSAAASLLVAVGVTTIYFQNRPAAWNEAVTSQAPEVAVDDSLDDLADVPEAAPIPEVSSAPAAGAEPDSVSADEQPAVASPSQPPTPSEKTQPEFAQPSLPSELEINRPPFETGNQTELRSPAAINEEPLADIAKPPAAAVPQPAQQPEIASAPIAAPPADQGAGDAMEETTAIQPELSRSEPTPSSIEPRVERARQPDDSLSEASGDVLSAIATQLAPYQPMNATYPLVYRLQIAADGTITNLEAIDEAPAIALTTITPAPGRSLSVELTYTGAARPMVREVFE
ncbi:MAG: hypothetical protein AAF821_20170 [Cyanobacteria bacterium P01_D01_bin.156]